MLGLSSFMLLFLISLYDIFAIFMVIESLFFLFLVLSVSKFTKEGVEIGVKYFVQNVFITGLSSFGIFIIYYTCKSTNFFIVVEAIKFFTFSGSIAGYNSVLFFVGTFLFLTSILFKIGVFPVHFYVADLYEASAYPIIFFFSAVVKSTFLFLFFKVVYLMYGICFSVFSYIFVFVGLSSLVFGTIGALYQLNIKRFLGYTSINQFGFLILCFSLTSAASIIYIALYLFLYLLFLIPFFYLATILASDRSYERLNPKEKPHSLENFSDFSNMSAYPSFQYATAISFFFISGLPPFLLFFYKYYLLLLVVESEYISVAILIILFNILSVIYYLKIIKSIFFEDSVLPYVVSKQHSLGMNSTKRLEVVSIFISLLITVIISSIFVFLKTDFIFSEY